MPTLCTTQSLGSDEEVMTHTYNAIIKYKECPEHLDLLNRQCGSGNGGSKSSFSAV